MTSALARKAPTSRDEHTTRYTHRTRGGHEELFAKRYEIFSRSVERTKSSSMSFACMAM